MAAAHGTREAAPIKVLWLIKGLGVGGAEKLLFIAAPYVNRSLFDYEVAYFLPWKSALVSDLEHQHIPTMCLPQERAFDPRIVLRLAALIRERRIDLVHAHLPYAGVVGRLAAKLAAVPCVYTEHNVQERYHPLTRLLNRSTMRLCSRVIAVSEEVRRSLVHGSSHSWGHVVTIPNGVDVTAIRQSAAGGPSVRELLTIPSDHRVVGTVSIFRRPKRLDLWVRAARHIADAEPNTTFVVVGDGPARGRISALADAEGLSGRVRFTGMRPDPARFISAFDVFMLSSDYEGLPVAVLEAMAVGIPVVATRVGGLPDAVDDGIQGFLVEARNPAALAAKVVTILRDDAVRLEMGRAAQHRVAETFSVEGMVGEVERIYAQLLKASAVPREPAPVASEP